MSFHPIAQGYNGISGPQYNVVLRVKHSNKALDNASDVCIQWDLHGNPNQRFDLVPVAGDYTNTWYNIVSKANGKCIDIEGAGSDTARALLWTIHGGENQQFRFVPRGDGYFSIHTRHNDKVLDISGNSPENKAQVIIYTFAGNANQLWRIESDAPQYAAPQYGAPIQPVQNMQMMPTAHAQTGLAQPQAANYPVYNVMLVAKHSGRALDNASDVAIQWDIHGNPNQRWDLIPVQNTPGWFNIVSKANGKFLDVEGSGDNGARVLCYQNTNGKNQQWQFIPHAGGNGYYSIHAHHNGKALDIAHNSHENKAQAIIYNFGGCDNQLWRVQL